jgi:hypothetical protein
VGQPFGALTRERAAKLFVYSYQPTKNDNDGPNDSGRETTINPPTTRPTPVQEAGSSLIPARSYIFSISHTQRSQVQKDCPSFTAPRSFTQSIYSHLLLFYTHFHLRSGILQHGELPETRKGWRGYVNAVQTGVKLLNTATVVMLDPMLTSCLSRNIRCCL